MRRAQAAIVVLFVALVAVTGFRVAQAAPVTVELSSPDVTFVGAINRWDAQGNPRRPVDPQAKLEAPTVDAVATRAEQGRWVFADLPAGTYDLVILAGRLRIEGWTYAPVLEFDPFFPPTALVSEETRQTIVEDIRQASHYENHVEPLALGGDDKVVRVLMMLVRDKPTSYEHDVPGAATLRHEIWQYTSRYGRWTKEKRTRVFDRVLLPREELRRWTWLWDPALGGLEVSDAARTISYILPNPASRPLPGLYPAETPGH